MQLKLGFRADIVVEANPWRRGPGSVSGSSGRNSRPIGWTRSRRARPQSLTE
jgi:hypothetical protein